MKVYGLAIMKKSGGVSVPFDVARVDTAV